MRAALVAAAAAPASFHTSFSVGGNPTSKRGAARTSSRTHQQSSAVRAPSTESEAPPEVASSGVSLTIHYHRAAGDYAGWGVHVWGDVEQPTSWDAPILASPIGASSEWATFVVPLTAAARRMSFLLHRGNEEDVRVEQFNTIPKQQNLASPNVEKTPQQQSLWIISGSASFFTAEPDLNNLPKGDLSKSKAIWVTRDAFAVPSDFLTAVGDGENDVQDGDASNASTARIFSLVASASASLSITSDGVDAPDAIRVPLEHDGEFTWDTIPEALEKFPHLRAAGYALLRISGIYAAPDFARKLTQSQLVLTCKVSADTRAVAHAVLISSHSFFAPAVPSQDASDGSPVDATGVQLQGALDDLFATNEPLGVTFAENGGGVRITVWAPTAQHVSLLLYDSPDAPTPTAEVPMKRSTVFSGEADTYTDSRSMDASPASSSSPDGGDQGEERGVWVHDGDESNLLGQYYQYKITVFSPWSATIVTSIATDPYARSLNADGSRVHIVNLDSPELAPAGWSKLAAAKPPLDHFSDVSIYELHVRDFSAMDDAVPEEVSERTHE